MSSADHEGLVTELSIVSPEFPDLFSILVRPVTLLDRHYFKIIIKLMGAIVN